MIYLTMNNDDRMCAEIDLVARRGNRGRYRVIVRDCDSNNIVAVVWCISFDQAKQKAHYLVNAPADCYAG